MVGQGTARALTMLEIRMTLDSINRWLKAIHSGHHILQHELERQFKSRPNHRQILYELAQQQLITPVVFRSLLALADDTGRIQRFSPVASMVPHRPDGVQSTAAAASVTASIHNQGLASSPSTITTPPPPVAVQAPTTPASTPAAATRSVSITEVDHGAANVVPHMDVPFTTKSLATCSTYLPTGTHECSVADVVQLVSGPRHAIVANKEDDPHELITHVGGVSLFLEPCVEPAEVVFSESHLMEQLLASRVSRQWDPGIQLGYWWVLFQYFQEYLQSSLDPKVCANISKNDHLLDDITPCQDSGQQGICRSGSMVHLNVPQLATRKYESVGVDGQFYLVVGNSFALVMYCNCRSAFVYVSAFFQWEIAWLLRLGCHLSAIRYPLPLMVLCSASSATLSLVVLSSSDLVFAILVREVQGAVQMDRYILEEHMAIILFWLLKLTQEADGKRIFDLLTLNKRFEQLVNSHRVILFMKGNPEERRCGFSQKEDDILKQEGVEFGSFDILADNEVREGMKKFSNWPTFPQLYCKGELLGGCDIVIARHESGELKDVLKEHNIPLRPQGSKIEKPVTSESANEKSPKTIGLTEAQKARLENLTNSNPVMIFIKVHPRSPSVDSVGRSFIFLCKKIISATARWTNSKVSKLTAFCAQARTTVCHHVSKPLLDVKHLFPSICRLIDITRPWDLGTSWFRLSSLIWNSDLIETASRPALSVSHYLRASNVSWGR